MKKNLISLTQYPTMPFPWDSIDAGESWVWGDYVLIIQTEPIQVSEGLAKISGQTNPVEIAPIKYPFVMTVFYRKDKNPHGPSSRPILVATLEIVDYAATLDMMGVKGVEVPKEYTSVVKGLFTAESRLNLGEFLDELSRDSARKYFLGLVREYLTLEDEPIKIGVIDSVHGHPDTGFSAQTKENSNGWLSAIVILIIFVGLVVFFG